MDEKRYSYLQSLPEHKVYYGKLLNLDQAPISKEKGLYFLEIGLQNIMYKGYYVKFYTFSNTVVLEQYFKPVVF